MIQKRIVTCAVTGSAPIAQDAAVPITPQEIAKSALTAADAGAAVLHIHVRDVETGAPSMELRHYQEVFDRIRNANEDVLINMTTGVGATYVPGDLDRAVAGPGSMFARPEDRISHVLALRPEICTLDLPTMWLETAAYINAPLDVRTMAREIRAAGVKPELEVFQPGDLVLAAKLIEEGAFEVPVFIQLALGFSYGAAADTRTMQFLVDKLPPNTVWSAFGVSSSCFPMLAQAALLGGNVRVGLEDTQYLTQGQRAPSNAALVDKAVEMLGWLDLQPATPAEAREILGLRPLSSSI